MNVYVAVCMCVCMSICLYVRMCIFYTIGYFQDDILTSILTIKENVYLSTSLRLPVKCTVEKKKRSTKVIEELGLSHVADSLVTTYYVTVNSSN